MIKATEIWIALLAVGALGGTGTSIGQVSVRQLGGAAGQPVGSYNPQPYVSPWSGPLRWLVMPQIRQEIELIDSQAEKIDQIRSDVQTEMSGLYKGLQDLPREERTKGYYDKSKKLAEKVEQQIKEVLLPEQLDRLDQISLRMRLGLAYRSYGGSGNYGSVLASDDVADKLRITESQKEKLLAAQRELQQETQEKVRDLYARMREESEQRAMTILTPKQREQLKQMLGDEFEYKYPQPGGSLPQKK